MSESPTDPAPHGASPEPEQLASPVPSASPEQAALPVQPALPEAAAPEQTALAEQTAFPEAAPTNQVAAHDPTEPPAPPEQPMSPAPFTPIAHADAVARANHRRAQAFEQSLVLHAEAIPHQIAPGQQGLTVWVQEEDAPRAAASLQAWQQENLAPTEVPRRRWEGQTPAPIFVAICLAGQIAIGDRDEKVGWFARGTADAAAILHGELWRCATALTLHADLAHALGNAVVGFIFIDALARRLGPAWAAWITLCAGVAGNWLTAHAVHGQHFSIGASTAVFGALGAVTAVQLLARERRGFITLGAGIGLLGFLGTSKQADLFAHLFGALAGFVLGLVAGLLQREAPKEKALQPLLAIAALIPLAAAWWTAIH